MEITIYTIITMSYQIFTDEEYAKKLQQQLQDEEFARNLQQQFHSEIQSLPSTGTTVTQDHLENYTVVINKVVNMANDPSAQSLSGKYGLNITNVTWEDNARSKNSSWGPCISDMTLQVEGKNMPVIRSPNYEDLTWDVPMDKIPLLVGNEHGENLRSVTLTEYLQNFRWNLHNPNSWSSSENSLYAPRDSHVIMSAQACFLPVPKLGGEATFNVAIFNYQSSPGHPAVLAIVASSKGTSAQIVDRNEGWGGQKLYFNQNGQRCSFQGERLSQHRIEKGETHNLSQPMSVEEKQQNMLLIIQVPLIVHRQPPPSMFCSNKSELFSSFALQSLSRSNKETADVEDAIITVGKAEGPFREVGDLSIKRDPSFPVRVTLQYYKATSNGIADDTHIQAISNQIKESRKYAEAIGSLVVGGKTGRVTEHIVNVPSIPPWWHEFWLTYGGVYPQFKSSEEAAHHVFKNGRFCSSSMGECQGQVLSVLGNYTPTVQPTWNVL